MAKYSDKREDESTERLGVREIIELNENRNADKTKTIEHRSNTGKSTLRKGTKRSISSSIKSSRCGRLGDRFIGSRWIGSIIGPLYGVFVFYYITFLILDGPPFTVKVQKDSGQVDNGDVDAKVDVDGIGVEVIHKTGVSTSQDVVLIDKQLSYITGACFGATTSVILFVGSALSPKIRCGMMLVIPSLCAKRGRSFMLTAAAGFLLAGPIATIDYNIQQVVNSFTCMYEQVKTMSDLYVEQFEKIWEDIMTIFKHINTMMDEYKRRLAEFAQDATEDVRKEVEAAQQKMEEQAEELKDKLSGLQKVLNAPGKAAGWLCEKGKSALALGKNAGESVGKWFKKAANDVGDAFKSIGDFFGRRKRSSCGIPNAVPDVDMDIPDVNLNAMKNFLKKLKPDMDLVDFDLKNIFADLEHSSIADIRARLKHVLKMVFEAVRKYSGYIEKVFYLSIVLVIRDALKYMKKYYSDDSFDNMMVDDNLRELWRNGDKEKIIPLRKWELKQKFQYSAAVRISKSEAKRIILNAIPSILFAIVVVCILVTDYALTHILMVFREEGQFGISYAGMEQGISFNTFLDDMQSGDLDISALKLQGFNLTTEPCLPRAMKTDPTKLAPLIILVLVSLISCVTDAYASRLQAKICNRYFPERAHQRAEYLYKRIQTGRSTRRIQLPMIVGRELDRRARSKEFCSYWNRLYDLTCGRRKIEPCPSCLTAMAKKEQATYSFKRKGTTVETPICNDCLLDV